MTTLFPNELARVQYLVRWLVYIVAIGVIAALLIPLPRYIGAPFWAPIPIIALLALMRVPCLDIPRMKSIGWSPWLLLLLLVPVAGFVVQILLFVAAPKTGKA